MKVREPSPMGPLVVALRQRLGLSQRQYAKTCDIERDRLSNIENGRNHLTGIAIRQSLAMGAGMTIEALNAYLDDGASLESLGVPDRSGAAAPARAA